MQVPLRGQDGLVLILHAGERKAILRVYTLQRRSKAEAHIRASLLLLREGVRVPNIYYNCLDDAVEGLLFVLEEYIDGESRGTRKLTEENVRAIACQLARMHSILNPHWGMLGAERTDSYFRELRGCINSNLTILEKSRLLSNNERQKAEKWFLGFKDLVDKSFSLTQKDLHPGNAVFSSENGEHYFIDVGRLQWRPAAENVLRAHRKLFRDDEEKLLIFNEVYFAQLPRDLAAHTRDSLPFFTALQLLTTSAKSRNGSEDTASHESLQRLRLLVL
ncbi:MAG: aminoglycoside phosphotransferase family protein [Candidatus Sumerlaeaceae bacterium]